MIDGSLRLRDKRFELFISNAEIQDDVQRIAAEISSDYAGKPLVCVVILKGAVVFGADLVRALSSPCQLEFLRASSYGDAIESSGRVRIGEVAADAFRDKEVLIIEDIIDTGLTISALTQRLYECSPRSVRVATLLFKPKVFRGTTAPHYIGRSIPPKFVVGYGMDYAEQGRNLRDIWVMSEPGGDLPTA